MSNPYRRLEVIGEILPPDPAERETKSAIGDAEKFGVEAAEVISK
jgi:hypothetical protein